MAPVFSRCIVCYMYVCVCVFCSPKEAIYEFSCVYLYRLRQWLVELVGSSRGDPVLQLHWVPNLSMKETAVYMNIKSEADRYVHVLVLCVVVCYLYIQTLLHRYSHSIHIQLKVDTVTVALVEGGTASCQMDKDKLLRILRHQVCL